MTLTLPIVVGKKYVRRDGKVVTAEARNKFVTVFADNENRARYPFNSMAFPCTGRINSEGEPDTDNDLVSDYIEPAKGHPHAALMAEFAKDAAECEKPWERWEVRHHLTHADWETCDFIPSWGRGFEYRRKPTITPDPHAESAAEYAKDMAETDKAWERWEMDFANAHQECWSDCRQHPGWSREMKYRRKGSL